MSVQRSSRTLSGGQILGILAFTLALFFMFSFAAKSVESYRLRTWRDELRQELADMERERDELWNELQHRQTDAWRDEALRRAGWLPRDVVGVIVVTPVAVSQTPAPPAAQATEASPEEARLLPGTYWQEWLDLLLGSAQRAP